MCTSASPQRQRSDWGLRVTQDAYFSLYSHIKQLLLVTFSARTNGGGGRTDRRRSRNSYLDERNQIYLQILIKNLQNKLEKSMLSIYSRTIYYHSFDQN